MNTERLSRFVTDLAKACPLAAQLIPEVYLMGDLNEEEREIFERHFFVCSECSQAVKIGSYILAIFREFG